MQRLPLTTKSERAEALTVNELAEMLGETPKSIYKRAQNGTLPFPVLRLGRSIRFSRRAVEAWLEGEQSQAVAKRAE